MGEPTDPTKKLQGVWAAIPTPFLPDGALDLDGATANAGRYAADFGLDGVFCNGIMGEGWALTVDERRQVLAAILAGAGERLCVGVVVTHHAPAEALALSRHAGVSGAHHIILMRPRGQYRDGELVAFCEAAADAAGLPMVLFESPAPGMSFGPDVIEALARKGLLLAVKAPGGDKAVAALRRRIGDGALICNPHEDRFLTELAFSPEAPLYANPEPYLFLGTASRSIHDYRRAFLEGDAAAALAHWRKLSPFRPIYDRWIIGQLDHGLSPVPALKHWAHRMGLATGPVRFPLEPLSPESARLLDAELDAAGVPQGPDVLTSF